VASASSEAPEISFERYRLPNGLKVLFHVDHRVPIAHVEVWYKVGSKDEAPNHTGLAHLFEHMMFEGTKQIPKGGYFKYLAEAGASARNGSTNTDRTRYFETLPSSQLELALWLESSRMGFLLDHTAFGATFANQREVVENERRQSIEDVPLGAVAGVQLGALFPVGHPYHHEVIGSMPDLNAASESDLEDFYNRYYAPGNAVLLIAGDIDTAAAKGLVDKYFGPITAGPPLVPSPPPTLPPRQVEERLTMEANVHLPYGQMAWNTVPVFTPGDAELDMLAGILGEGTSSRLYRLLVRDLKIAESVSVSHLSRMYGGTFEIDYTAMKGHNLTEIEKVIDEALQDLRSLPPARAEVERARNQIKTDLLREMEPLPGLASRLLYYDLFAADPGYLRQDLDRYEKATPQDLESWAQRILNDSQRVVINVHPNAAAPIMGRLLPTTAPTLDTPRSADARVLGRARPADTQLRTSPDATFRTRPPHPAQAKPFALPDVKRFQLKNGLPVVLAESHDLPLVNLSLIVKTGDAANPKDKAGLASLVAAMLDEGTSRRSAADIAGAIEQLGAELTAWATWDTSVLSLDSLTRNLDRALPVWADVLLDPAFSEDDLQRLVRIQLADLESSKDFPASVADQVFSRALWGDGHPFAWPEAGTEASLPTLRRDDLRRFYATFYAPNNAVLAVAGDITEEDVRTKIEPLLASWRRKRIPSLVLPEVEAPAKTHIVFVDKTGAPESSIRIGLPGIARASPDYYRAWVTNHILGGTFKRLALNLRETKGWTYGVTSAFHTRRAAGPWLVRGEFEAAHTADAVQEIRKEIDRMRFGDITAQELADTKAELTGSLPARFATPGQLARQVATLLAYDLPPTEWSDFDRQIAAVDAEQVRATARKYFRTNNLLIVVVGDRATNEMALHKLAPMERRDAEGALVVRWWLK
jgi:zinc protease